MGILNHPYMLEQDSVRSEVIADIQRSQRVYVEAGRIAVPRGYRPYFPLRTDGRSLPIIYSRYLPVSADCRRPKTVRAGAKFFSVIIDNLCQVGTSLRDDGLEVTVPVFHRC